MRKAYGETLAQLGKERDDIVVLDGDLSKSTKTEIFAREFPERFFDLGISEQDIMSTASGLALSGKTVFASSFAIFATGRAYNQVRNNICYMNLNVKIVATHAGISIGEDGSSHQALEDISLMRGIPNMRVIAPADSTTTREVIKFVANAPGPFYIRLLRPDAPVIYEKPQFRFGEAVRLRDGNDVSIFTHGFLLHIALEASELLEKRGIKARVYDHPTIKPIDESSIDEAALETNGIVVAEDHHIFGGLGSSIAEYVVTHNPVKMDLIGTENFGQSGSTDMLYKEYGFTPIYVADRVERLLDRI